mmetsp:Transcript_98747/g.178288  ORF Transcript_98747/g.178288 Transcript_98747/m.178288 type:complete len:594 (-) Transcript_98747:70-1851(-)
MAMNNSDFKRLLATDDKALVQALTKNKSRPGGGGKGKDGKGEGKGEGKGKGEGGGKGKSKTKNLDDPKLSKGMRYKLRADMEAEKKASMPAVAEYKDRASERREMKGEYEKVAAEFENHGEVSAEQSKYLGGDMDHTHLVKGLDFALLNKVRTELTKQKKIEEFQQAKQERKAAGGVKKRAFESLVGKNIWSAIVDTLHPHHKTFKERVQRMGKAISLGQRIRGAPSFFLPGRMAYEFDTDVAVNVKSDIPRIVYSSKEDAPSHDSSRKPSGILPDSVMKVKNSIARALEERKNRKLQKEKMGSQASYTAAQKVATKVKAKDVDNDIFGGAGTFDVAEVVRKARAEQAAKKAASGVKEEPKKDEKAAAKSSYFDDAGSEKYRKAPEGQLELDEVHFDEGPENKTEFHVPTGNFESSSKFRGARKNWHYKLGEQGLGYYEEVPPSKSAPASSSSSSKVDPRRKNDAPVRSKKDPQGMGATPSYDAYDDLYPENTSGGAMVQTGEDLSDEEEEPKKGVTIGKKKGDVTGPDSVASNRKGGALPSKKQKMSENTQWQKIEGMIAKGNLKNIDTMEAEGRSSKRGSSSAAGMTPAFF